MAGPADMDDGTGGQAAHLREALLDQLTYLIDEVEGVKALVDRVPRLLLAARPLPGVPSIKEMYGLFATMDEAVYVPRLRQMIEEEVPFFEAQDEASLVAGETWNDQPIVRILERVQTARQSLVSFLSALPPEGWLRAGRFGSERRDVYGLLHHITQHDVDRLRAIGYRLHENLFLTK